MSTRSIVFAAAVLAGGLFSSGASAVEGTTTADALMRVGPGDEFAEIGEVDAGSSVKIQSCHTGLSWCLVRVSGRSGWVHSTMVKAGGFAKAPSYFDPDARPSPGSYVFDYGIYGDEALGLPGYPVLPSGRIDRSRFSDKRLPRDFPFVDRRHVFDKRLPRDFRLNRSHLSDKRLPRDFRSTIHTPGFRLFKQDFPAIIGD